MPSDPNLTELEQEKARLDRVAKLLITKDLELQRAYDQLEQAYNDVIKEKDTLLVERNRIMHVVSGIADAVIALDNEGKIIMFNQSAQRVTGCVESEVFGKPFDSVLQLKTKEESLNERLHAAPVPNESGVVLDQKAAQIDCLSGKVMWADVLATRVTGRSGVNVGYVVTLHDVSERRQLEEMKLDFVSMAAHELRTPLTAIVGYLAVFTKENEGKVAPDQLMLLNRVNISAQRLRGLVENLLSVTKIERGALSMSPEPIDWVQNVTQIVEEFQLQAQEEGVTLTFAKPNVDVPKIHVDVLRINEVLINLISNAITYTPKGGSVAVSIQAQDNDITTSVKDDGPGIPQDAIPHLFTKFFRVAGKLEQGSKGTGLGLYISKTIVELHKGKIWVESTLGKGTAFHFTLHA